MLVKVRKFMELSVLSCGGRGQRAKGKRQTAKGKGQTAKGRRQRADGRRQRAEGKLESAEGIWGKFKIYSIFIIR